MTTLQSPPLGVNRVLEDLVGGFGQPLDRRGRPVPVSRALWLKHEHPTYDRVGSTFLGRENARDLWVSTVWLGPLLAWPGQPFETMIFSEDRDDQAQWRWPTLRQAQIGHRQVVRAVRRALHVPVPLARPYPRGHW